MEKFKQAVEAAKNPVGLCIGFVGIVQWFVQVAIFVSERS